MSLLMLYMNFVPVAGNVIPLYGHNTVAPAFLHNSEAELYLMYELAVEHWNATRYERLDRRLRRAHDEMVRLRDAFVGANRQAAGTWGASHAAEEGRVERFSADTDLISHN